MEILLTTQPSTSAHAMQTTVMGTPPLPPHHSLLYFLWFLVGCCWCNFNRFLIFSKSRWSFFSSVICSLPSSDIVSPSHPLLLRFVPVTSVFLLFYFWLFQFKHSGSHFFSFFFLFYKFERFVLHQFAQFSDFSCFHFWMKRFKCFEFSFKTISSWIY